MKHVMMDFETWNNTPDAVVVQIGACYFDTKTKEIGESFEMHIDAKTEMNRGFTVGADTLYWWFKQDKEAQILAMGSKVQQNESLMAWQAFNAFLSRAEHIWSHASFDAAILTMHNKKLGITPTYKYWALKDLRTLTLLSQVDTRVYKRKTTGCLHNALDDCKVQIDYAVDSFNKLRR